MTFKKSTMVLSFILTLMIGQTYADPIWIDVRTLSESLRDNIEGDIRISHSNIVREVSQLYPDKSTELYLYDKTGGRSDIAKSALEREGYENVHNAGSINEAREQRGIE